MKPKESIIRSEGRRSITIGRNVKTYRECAGIPKKIMADRLHIPEDRLDAIENGTCELDIKTVLKMSEELKVGYSDLFEAEDGRYYTNFSEPKVLAVIRTKRRERGMSEKDLSEKLGFSIHSFHNWGARGLVPNPFHFQNILAYLKITSLDLPHAYLEKPEPVKPSVEPKKDILSDVIKACEFYGRAKDIVTKLDQIIAMATELKKELEGVE